MQRVRIKYVKIYRDSYGKTRCYLRKPGCKSVPLPDPSSPDFLEAYAAALSGTAPEKTTPTQGRTLDNLIIRWMEGRHYTRLEKSTQQVYRRILDRLRTHPAASCLIDGMQPKHVRMIVSSLGQNSPTTGSRVLRLLHQVIQHAIAIGWMETDPTAGVKPPRREATEGIHSWTDGEIEQYENRWPSGTYQRLAFALLLYTGQRRSDVVRMGPADVRNGNLHIKQKKTKVELIIPIHPVLQREIDQWQGEAQTFLLGARGKPLSENGFYNVFKDWCREAGLPERCSPHGLRKAVARRLAEAGCSTHEIAAITGHKTLAEVGRYTRAASQPTMAKSGVDKLR
ncbi:MAG: tyrosine-type recombinase/integrase [Acetobacter sp.]|uniref:tyrosine-type recombinase/integrase n=1 Tax=Acetobacter sp. TaxID=440 RepID=UPI0039E7BC40